MGRRELLFGSVAVALLAVYVAAGIRLAPALVPGASPTPIPTKPVERVAAPTVAGTIAFAIRGDIYVLQGGGYVPLTSDGRSHQPTVSADGKTVVYTRIEEVDGKRLIDQQVVPAQLRFSNVVRKDASGGPETIVLNGLVKKPTGFHDVTWFDNPATSPNGKVIAVVADAGDGSSDLELFDTDNGKLVARLSQGANLADPSWSPDGKVVAVTSYTLGNPRLLLVPADGRASTTVKTAADGEPYRPAFSPDGTWLVYTLRHDGKNDLRAVQLNSGRDVPITNDGNSWNGVFSPDGRQIAFLREHEGTIDLYFMDLADSLSGGSPKPATKLTRGEGVDGASRPSWGG